MMKNMNGLEVLAKLKADADVRDIPVVALSNVSDQVVVNQVKEAGAVQFVIKSNTEPASVVALVRAVLSNPGAANDGSISGVQVS